MLPARHAGVSGMFRITDILLASARKDDGLGARAGAKGSSNAHAERCRVLLPW